MARGDEREAEAKAGPAADADADAAKRLAEAKADQMEPVLVRDGLHWRVRYVPKEARLPTADPPLAEDYKPASPDPR
eukprot:CAMPEP_0118878312 /NCGR_PEP_ID=MMETSP1163-20130328/18262_1 /TAXON_ID=124430 /ORGANISM="Phaeomonas parva, Strain CCMP2877" /LENGTH=76 /DNA_ID=CAMNT_0006814121 /DNA_START=349 /DNA_END=576 /DNA_ORIENTATION=-